MCFARFDLGQVAIEIGIHAKAAGKCGVSGQQDFAVDVNAQINIRLEAGSGGIRVIKRCSPVDDHVLDHVLEANGAATRPRVLYDGRDLVAETIFPLRGRHGGWGCGGGQCAQGIGARLGVNLRQTVVVVDGVSRGIFLIDRRICNGGPKINAATQVGDGQAARRIENDRDTGADVEGERAKFAEACAQVHPAQARKV